jgi:TolB-like protein
MIIQRTSLSVLFVLALLFSSFLQASNRLSIAVWDFDNGSPMDRVSSDYLTKALPEILMSQLSNSPQLEIVERIHLREAMEEQKLGSSELADEDAQIKLGKIIGAKYMAFGGLMIIFEDARVDVRIVDVETSEVLFAEKFEGKTDGLIVGMQSLTERIVKLMGVESNKRDIGGNLDEWKDYEKGLVLIDERKYEDALTIFQTLLEKNSKFYAAEKQVLLILDLMARQ